MIHRLAHTPVPFLLATLIAICSPALSSAQAWVNLPGHGSVSATYTYFRGGDHLYSQNIDGAYSRGYTADGDRWYLGDTFTHTLTVGLDYGLYRRVGLSVYLSHVTGLYEGKAPVNVLVDDGDYHRSFQDAQIQLRYMALLHPLVVTPFVGYLFPTADYPDHGHAALGLGFSEFQFGVSAGRGLAPLLQNTYVHLHLLHSTGEERFGHRLRRTSIDLEIGRQIRSSLNVSATASYLASNGGEDWLEAEGSVHEPGPYRLGTAFSDSRYTRLGLGLSFDVLGPIGVSASFVSTIDGQNIEDGDFLSIGTNWNFATPLAHPMTR